MTRTTQQTPLEVALRYAAEGLHVFPCNPDSSERKGTPIGGLKDAEGRGGFYIATNDADQIREWWTRYPDAAIGWRLAADGFVAVDLDTKNGKDGIARWAELTGTETFGTDLVAETPSGGLHLVFRTGDPSAFRSTADDDGIDIRGDGGYLVIPNGEGSRRWRNAGVTFDQAAELTGAERAEVVARAAANRSLRRQKEGTKTQRLDLYADPASPFVEVEDALQAIPPSCDRTTWLDCIYAVHDALHGSAEGAALVEDWSSKTSTEGQYRRGEAASIYRAATPGDVRKGTLFHHAKLHGWRPVATGSQVTLGPNLQNTTPEVGGVLGGLPNGWGSPAPSRRKVTLRDAGEVAAMPVPAWRVLNVLPDAALALLVGDTMAGKTFVALDLALRLQHGMEFMGHDVKPCSTVYLPGEGFGGLTSRVLGWKQQHNPDPADADGRYVLIGDEVPELSSNPHLAAAAIRDVVEAAKAQKGHAPGLVIVDTLSQAMTTDENDATATSAVLRVLSDLRHDYGCTVLIVHHTRKQSPTKRDRGASRVDLDDARGSSTLTRNADTVLGISGTTDPTAFELVALKQKGGRCGFLARFGRVLVHTERTGEFGERESTCILVQQARPLTETLTKEERELQQLDDNIARIVDAMNARGADGRPMVYGSREAVVKVAGIKAAVGRSALRVAEARGLVADLGNTKSPKLVLATMAQDVRDDVPRSGTTGRPRDDDADLDAPQTLQNQGETGGGIYPHTPRDDGTTSAEADPPALERPGTSGRRGTTWDDGTTNRAEAELVEPEDQGRPRQQGGSRRRSKR